MKKLITLIGVMTTLFTISALAQDDAKVADCFWGKYYAQIEALHTKISNARAIEDTTADLGIRSGARLDRINAQSDLDLLKERLKTYGYLKNERGETNGQALTHAFSSMYTSCVNISSTVFSGVKSDLEQASKIYDGAVEASKSCEGLQAVDSSADAILQLMRKQQPSDRLDFAALSADLNSRYVSLVLKCRK